MEFDRTEQGQGIYKEDEARVFVPQEGKRVGDKWCTLDVFRSFDIREKDWE